ncbi:MULTISPECIES: SpaH/EbpB family LPXTG-anchored major pilin [Corynebacterium]|uniref:SpaH/EbpB family LPXTG-anchored major pilin n=1 Tax=Corynebacterium TaxID=1716 RepID=UPI00119E19D6|nr:MULTISPECIES: SpaH/EbpB family LPXTG-anchored major pilin [Corynebacterium]MCQ9676356.1 SpaH/EbpB family LPXTG-anchored major pilin [Corynebacterium sp. BF-R-2]
MSKAIAGKKAAAFSAAFAIALSAGVVGADANVAHAQSEAPAATASTTADADQQQGNSNPENAPKDGLSLTIHKLKGTESGEQGNGTEQNLPNDPAKGVDYTIELVQPLNTPKDWKTAAGIKNADEAKAFTGEGAYSVSRTTDDKGEIKLTGLKAGLYKVTETKVPDDSGLVIAKPFLVYVPMTNPDAKDGWLKDVHAYPKNTEVKVEKKVKDQFANNGEDYTYTITSSIPLKKEGETLTKYIVTDELDSKLDGANSKVTKVALGASEDAATELKAGTDYDVEAVDGNDQIKKVVFTEEGLKKLKSTSDKVFTTIQTKTKGDATVYHVPNDAKLTVSHNPKGEYDTTVTSNEVDTYWGDLKIVKQDGNNTDKKLKGAEFQLVQCQADGDAWKQTPNTSAEEVKGETSWTTDENGTVTIKGIHVTDFADNEDKANDYCLKETKAPAGYVKYDALIPFKLKKGEHATTDANGNITEIKNTATVDNYSDENHLPNTGGAGFIAIVMAGLAIIGGGFFAARRNSVKA